MSSLQQVMVAARHYREHQKQKWGLDIGDREMLLLSIIGSHEGISVSDTAAAFNRSSTSPVSESTISVAITDLWNREYVEKVISRQNQRVTTLRLTDKGKGLLEKDRLCREERTKLILSVLPEEDRAKLGETVRRLTATFEEALG